MGMWDQLTADTIEIKPWELQDIPISRMNAGGRPPGANTEKMIMFLHTVEIGQSFLVPTNEVSVDRIKTLIYLFGSVTQKKFTSRQETRKYVRVGRYK